jgi:hypothetical protein
MPPSFVRHARVVLAAGLGVLACVPAHAIDAIGLGAALAEGPGWSARGVQVEVDPGSEGTGVVLTIQELALPAPIGVLRGVRARCDGLRLAAGAYACDDASAVLDTRHRPGTALRGRFAFTPGAGRLDADLTLTAADGAPLRIRAALAEGRWTVDARADAYAIAALAPWLGEIVEWPGTGPPSGTLGLDVHAALRGGALESVRVQATLSALTFAAFGERLATESFDGEIALDARADGGALAVDVRLHGAAGQVYAEPWYVDAQAQPFTLTGSGRLDTAARLLALTELRVDQPGVLEASGTAELEPSAVRALTLTMDDARMPAAYATYLQPLLIGTVLDDLETLGRVTGRLEIAEGRPGRIDVVLDDVSAEDRGGRFGVYGVAGPLRWARAGGRPMVSKLGYRSAALYGIPFDAGAVRVESEGGALRLLDTPVRAALLDGALLVRTLALRGLGSDDIEADFDAVLEPIDVAKLTSALGWVPFAGTLSGRLPTLRYAADALTLGGTLEAEVFGGRIDVAGLRLDQPLGVLPTLHADMHMRDIDLEKLTSTFSFGHMTGRLHADVTGLEVIDWRATRFDARVYTPADDESTHRISQRAVSSIAALGGGVAAGLQKGFLGLFDEFAYDRIDLSCRMRNQVCAMSGIEAAGSGYYILRGKGLPRIDVIGYERSVSWPAFADALIDAARNGDFVIE